MNTTQLHSTFARENQAHHKTWLSQFQKSRTGIRHGSPLYRYHLSLNEYLALRDVLAKSYGVGSRTIFSSEWCASFVLYCSEWFRREYNLEWSWNSIHDTLGFELSPQQRSDVVQRGLKHWGRSVSRYENSQGNNYLGSVFREGGLPTKLLSDDHNGYQDAFSKIFGRYSEAKELGQHSVRQLIQSRIQRLPEALQGDDSVELFADMLDKLDSLVYQFGLDRQSVPANYLDIHCPNWRTQFPLPLEDDIGTRFLNNLLVIASNEVKKKAKKEVKLSCTHYFSWDNQSIRTEVTLPHKQLFMFTREQLSVSRIDLVLFEGQKLLANLGTGYAQFDGEQCHVVIRKTRAEVKRVDAKQRLSLVAMQSGEKLAQVSIGDSELDWGEVPVILSEEDGEWRVLGQASLSIRKKHVYILISEEAKTETLSGELTDTPYRFCRLKVCQVTGTCLITLPGDDTYRIATGCDDPEHVGVMLESDVMTWQTKPTMIFRGLRVINHAATRVTGESLDVCLDGKSVSHLTRENFLGKQRLTIKKHSGEVLLRKQVGVLPADFDISFKSGDAPNTGVIIITTAAPKVCAIKTPGVILENIEKSEKQVALHLLAEGTPPSSVQVDITLNMLGEAITFILPFPSKGAVAFNAHGKPLAQRLTVDDLLGSRLHLFSMSGQVARYQIEASSNIKGIKQTSAPYYRWQYVVSDKPVEVSLYALKTSLLELLSLNNHLDSIVDLVISGPGKTLRFSISHYSSVMDYDRERNVVYARSNRLADTQALRPALMHLTAPEQAPIYLESLTTEGVSTGEFALPSYVTEGGPWLVVPASDSDVLFRAKFIPCMGEQTNDCDVKTLQKASRLFHPSSNPNVIADVFHQMKTDWGHSGWQYLRDTYKNYGHLPLSTFEVFKYLVRDTKALAVALFQFELNPELISRLESELPVFWQFVPLVDWRHAIQLQISMLEGMCLPAEIVDELMAKQITKLVDAIPALSDEVAIFLETGKLPQLCPSALMEILVHNEWYQDLLRQNAENNSWPTEFGADLKRWCTQSGLMPFEIKTNAWFHDGVVYLPVFAAAVVTELVPAEVSSTFRDYDLFHLRKLRDFDCAWFEPVFRCFVSYFLLNQTGN